MTPSDSILARYYTDAARRLRAIVLHPPGRTESSREFRRARASELVDQVSKIVTDLRGKAAGWTGRAMNAAWREGIANADAQIKTAFGRSAEAAIRPSFALVNAAAVKAFADSTAQRQTRAASGAAGDLDRAARSMGERATRLIRDTAQLGLDEAKINAILAGGVIEGTPVATIRQLREELRAVHGEQVEVRTKSGGTMNFDVAYYARMVAVTKTRQATEIGRRGRLAEVGIDLVRIVGRHSNNFCTAFLSQVFSLSGTHPRYPSLDSLPGGGPPFHPNCSKSTAAFVERLATDEQREAAEPDSGSRTLIGMTPTQAQRTYKDLQLRPAAEQRDRAVERSIGDAALLDRARRES